MALELGDVPEVADPMGVVGFDPLPNVRQRPDPGVAIEDEPS